MWLSVQLSDNSSDAKADDNEEEEAGYTCDGFCELHIDPSLEWRKARGQHCKLCVDPQHSDVKLVPAL